MELNKSNKFNNKNWKTNSCVNCIDKYNNSKKYNYRKKYHALIVTPLSKVLEFFNCHNNNKN